MGRNFVPMVSPPSPPPSMMQRETNKEAEPNQTKAKIPKHFIIEEGGEGGKGRPQEKGT